MTEASSSSIETHDSESKLDSDDKSETNTVASSRSSVGSTPVKFSLCFRSCSSVQQNFYFCSKITWTLPGHLLNSEATTKTNILLGNIFESAIHGRVSPKIIQHSAFSDQLGRPLVPGRGNI